MTDQPAFLRTKVDCQPTLAYACDMKPPGELGLKDFPTPHALTLPRLLLMTSWALFGALTWIAFQKPWGQVGYGIFNLLGIIVGFLITRIILEGRLRVFFPLPLCRRGKCRTLGRDYVWRLGTLLHPFWIRNERQLFVQMRVWRYVRPPRNAIHGASSGRHQTTLQKACWFSQMGRRFRLNEIVVTNSRHPKARASSDYFAEQKS